MIKIRNIYTKLEPVVRLFTDGSASPSRGVGAWASCVLMDDTEHLLDGTAQDTSQHTMELVAVLKGLEFIQKHAEKVRRVEVYTDSQYVAGLPGRRERLERGRFFTKKGKPVKNSSLIRELYGWLDKYDIVLHRVPGHNKAGKSEITDYNRKVDKHSRALVRAMLRDDQ